MQRALVAVGRKQPDRALSLLAEATELARAAGGNRIVAEIALDAARIQRERNQLAAAERTLRDGIQVARSMQEQLLLPRLLAQLADLRSSQGRFAEASALLDEAGDILKGFFTTTSSPWVQSRLISGMDEVFLARIRLEASRAGIWARVRRDRRGEGPLTARVAREQAHQRTAATTGAADR